MGSRRLRYVLMISAFMAAAVVENLARFAVTPAHAAQVDVPTYAKDVAPVLQKSCQVCHRPGEAGPFSLLTYEDARPRAAAIKSAIVGGRMPPWHADPHYGKFSNSMVPAEPR